MFKIISTFLLFLSISFLLSGCLSEKKEFANGQLNPASFSEITKEENALGEDKVESAVSKKKSGSFFRKTFGELKKKLGVKSKKSEAQVEAGVAQVIKHKLYQYPELTLSLATKDARKTARLVKEAGGEIVYDPNLGKGYAIPFLIVTLPPEKVIDEEFIKSLDLKALSVDHPEVKNIRPVANNMLPKMGGQQIYVPTKDIGIPTLRAREDGKGLGEGATIAVIDTGVDASHPVFQDRVVFWSDETQEGRIPVEEFAVVEGAVRLVEQEEKKGISASLIRFFKKKPKESPKSKEGVLSLPKIFQDAEKVYVAKVSEKSFGAQSSDADKLAGNIGLDFNNNGTLEDTYLIVAGEVAATNGAEPQMVAVFDTDNDGKFSEEEGLDAVVDFNQSRLQKMQGEASEYSDMLEFVKAPRRVAYPVMFEKEDGVLKYLTIGVDLMNHGTHVAGIAAANGKLIKGAAPQANIMSLKVCSGLSCTEAAILRALVKTFYNDSGLVPDVVNISLGSHEQYSQDVFNFVMRDLAAKFGTTFFISASNSGPGYRSINSFGSFGPVVQVAAHVSKDTLKKHYSLENQIEISEHNLLSFTSLGPSYTGQLRPNIAAPGSAISSTPLINHSSQMMNGTSMSSPIAAGAATALLSLAKQNSLLKPVYDLVNSKRELILKGELNSLGSLAGVPLALRTSLEETAIVMNNSVRAYTMAHQGHGLIDVNAAYDKFVELASSWLNKETYFMDISINGGAKKGSLYDRSTTISPVKRIVLSLENDYELTDADVLDFETTSLTVKLEKVEVESSNNTVAVLTSNMPFSVQVEGTDNGGKGVENDLILGSGIKNYFFSVRHLNEMEEGKNYIAHYGIYHKEQRIFSMLDVVHKAYSFNGTAKQHYVPGIEHAPQTKPSAFSVANQGIAANGMHRYAFSVTELTTQLDVSLGLSPTKMGRMYLQVYDPDGKQVAFEVVSLSSQQSLALPKALAQVNTLGKPGIYEVTVAASSGRWMGPSTYDIMVEAIQFKPSVKHIGLNKEKTEQMISISNALGQVTTVEPSIVKMMPVIEHKEVPVVPNRWTYKKLSLPKVDEASATTVVVALALSEQLKEERISFSGRIDHNLYKIENGEFVSAHKANKEGSTGFGKIFPTVPLGKQGEDEVEALYFAIETFATVPEDKGVAGATKKLNFEVLLPEMSVPEKEKVQVSLLPESTLDAFLLKVNSIAFVEEEKTENMKLNYRGLVEVKTNVDAIKLNIPVTVSH